MLLHKLMGATAGASGIRYVGGRTGARAGSTSTSNILFNGISGGIGLPLLENDLVVVSLVTATQARTPTTTITSYTGLTGQSVTTQTYDVFHRVSYKFMPSTPESQFVLPSTGNIDDAQAYVCHIFRGVDPTTPLDVTSTYATSTGRNTPDPAAITPVTPGAWIVAAGGGAAATGTTLFTSSDLTLFLTSNGADTNDATVGAGVYTTWTSGAFNPAAFGGGSIATANSWAATTLALRPA